MQAPDKIYLLVDEPDHDEGIMWCQDQINDTDVAYVRADLASIIAARSERKIRWLRLMLAWAVRLAKIENGQMLKFLDLYETQKITTGNLRAENEALRQAGRGLYECLVMDSTKGWRENDVIDTWRKVDPQ